MKKDGNLGFAAIYAGVLVAFVSVPSSRAASVSFEAESGVLGSDFNTASNGTTQYITITTDTVNAEYPGNNNRVATYTVTFPAAGTYNFYARVRAGPGGATEDSFFYANGFGTKSFTTATDWIRLNSLLTGGFTNPSDSVTGSGTAGISVWKWLNLSQFANGSCEAGITFTVPTGNLTQTFQSGARENGFDMDKFVFATTDTTLTVAQLDADGSSPPPPPTPRDLVNGNLIQFNDNGAWSWYMDERVVIDKTTGKLVVGYDLSGSGVGGSPRNGSIEAVIYDLQTGGRQNSVLLPSGGHGFGCDDHDAPAFMVRPDGKYLATYAGHNNDNFSYFRIYSGGAWGTKRILTGTPSPGARVTRPAIPILIIFPPRVAFTTSFDATTTRAPISWSRPITATHGHFTDNWSSQTGMSATTADTSGTPTMALIGLTSSAPRLIRATSSPASTTVTSAMA